VLWQPAIAFHWTVNAALREPGSGHDRFMTGPKLDAQPRSARTFVFAGIIAAMAAAALSSCASPGELTRTSYPSVTVADITRRFDVERERSIPAATALDLSERATRLLAGSEPSAAPNPCDNRDRDTEVADRKTWQLLSGLVAGLQRVEVTVKNIDGLAYVWLWLMDNPDEDDYVEFHFEPGATDTNVGPLKCWKAGYDSSSRTTPSRTSYARATVAGVQRRFVVDHHISIQAATALDLTERATRLLADPAPSAAPAPCHAPDPMDEKTWKTLREAVAKWRRVSASVSRLDGHRFLKNENGIVQVSVWATRTDGFAGIFFKFEPVAGGKDEWSLKCWDLSLIKEVVVTS
jgi:hypothetical protein